MKTAMRFSVLTKALLVAFVLMIMIPLRLFASETDSTTTSTGIIQNSTTITSTYTPEEEFAAAGSTEQALEKITTKGFEIAKMAQTGCVPLCVVFFFAGCILLLYGAVSRTGLGKGVVVLLITGVVFVLSQYAYPILVWFSTWVTN